MTTGEEQMRRARSRRMPSCRARPGQKSALLRTVKRAAFLWFAILLQLSSPVAQENQEPPLPDRLRYVFDLPWCKAWQFACARCEKEGPAEIACTKTACTGNHEFFRCVEFAVDKQCARWTDGCNGCWWDRAGRATCTARICFDYRPRFTCVAPDSRGQK
jgi:hypothetical protein